jgi:hypothetical protein
MAKLPRDLSDWVKLLRKGWPRRALPADEARGLSALARQYLRADSAGRERMRTAVTELAADSLMIFAHRAAEKAVRRKDPDFLTQGLAALALGSERIDPRDVLVAFSLISHSAGKLRVDYRHSFEDARELGGKDIAELVEDWLDRTPDERSIDGMGYKEATGGKLFRYVHDDEDDDAGFDAWWFPARGR